jgi:hypothetical protein
MRLIFIRSPYSVQVDEANQIGSKVELFIWNKGTTKPTVPTYTLSKKAPSVSETKNSYNISNYVKEYIDIIQPSYPPETDEESIKQWCYVEVVSYKETTVGNYVEIQRETFVALNGFTNYLGSMQSPLNIGTLYRILTGYKANKIYKYNRNGLNEGQTIPNINIFIYRNSNKKYEVRYKNLREIEQEKSTIIQNPTTDFLFTIPISNYLNAEFEDGNIFEILVDDNSVFKTTFIAECEIKYTPMLCSFINKNGGWDYLTFFKAKTENWEVKNKEYQLLPNSLEYNPARGESKFFNYEAKQSIKINTGWVEEHYNDLIKDLMTSETILLDGVPVKLKTMTTDLKTSLQDKMINYTIDFEYNFNQINNVI